MLWADPLFAFWADPLFGHQKQVALAMLLVAAHFKGLHECVVSAAIQVPSGVLEIAELFVKARCCHAGLGSKHSFQRFFECLRSLAAERTMRNESKKKNARSAAILSSTTNPGSLNSPTAT